MTFSQFFNQTLQWLN